jgi:predicted nucleic-acid-binding protein
VQVIAFDTNYLVRHIVQDDKEQSRLVSEILESETQQGRSIRIIDLILMETAWVLETVYGFDRNAWSQVLSELIEDSAFCFDDSARLRRVIKQFSEGKADFSDYLIFSVVDSEGLKLKTFDKTLRKELQ